MDSRCYQFWVSSNASLKCTVTSFINSSSTRPYIGSSIVGCWLTDPLNYFFGRRGTLFWCGIFCVFSVIGQAFAQTWPQLFVRPLFLSIIPSLNLQYTGLPSTARLGYGSQSYHIPSLCRRKHTCQHPRRSCHVLAVMGKDYLLSIKPSSCSS